MPITPRRSRETDKEPLPHIQSARTEFRAGANLFIVPVVARGMLEASAASKPLRKEISSPGPHRANRLENNSKQFAPQT